MPESNLPKERKKFQERTNIIFLSLSFTDFAPLDVKPGRVFVFIFHGNVSLQTAIKRRKAGERLKFQHNKNGELSFNGLPAMLAYDLIMKSKQQSLQLLACVLMVLITLLTCEGQPRRYHKYPKRPYKKPVTFSNDPKCPKFMFCMSLFSAVCSTNENAPYFEKCPQGSICCPSTFFERGCCHRVKPYAETPHGPLKESGNPPKVLLTGALLLDEFKTVQSIKMESTTVTGSRIEANKLVLEEDATISSKHPPEQVDESEVITDGAEVNYESITQEVLASSEKEQILEEKENVIKKEDRGQSNTEKSITGDAQDDDTNSEHQHKEYVLDGETENSTFSQV